MTILTSLTYRAKITLVKLWIVNCELQMKYRHGSEAGEVNLTLAKTTFNRVLSIVYHMRYMVQQWQQQVKEKVPLTPIIPPVAS